MGGINWVLGHRSFVSLEYESKLRRLKAGMTLIRADAYNSDYIGKKVGFTDSVSKEPAFFQVNLSRSLAEQIILSTAALQVGIEADTTPASGLEKADAPPKLQAAQELGDAPTPPVAGVV